jgi:sec-independent protein translocase protein TatA
VIEDLFTPQHLIILFAILFFLFGAKKLPGLGKSLGHSIREFRSGISGLSDADPAEEVSAADDQTAALAAADSGAQAAGATSAAADATAAADAATPATAETSAAAEASAVAADPALDDADIEDADYTELDGDVTSEVVGEMSEAEGAVAAGPQA